MVKHKISINIAKPGGTPSPVVRSGTMQIRKRILDLLWSAGKRPCSVPRRLGADCRDSRTERRRKP